MKATDGVSTLEASEVNLCAFEPDAERVRVLDQHMRRRLGESIRHIADRSAGHLHLPADAVEAFLTRLAQGPIAPLTFSYYSDIVTALEDDDISSAQSLFDALLVLPSADSSMRVTDMGDPRHELSAGQYASFFATDTGIQFDIYPPPREISSQCRRQIDEAMRLIDACDPAASSEIRALLREIVLAVGSDDAKAYTFDGASSFMLWGAIILNANRNDGEIGMVQMIAHETAHNLLFGIGSDSPLVLNEPDELYPSPLRHDPRPMDGIYHATYVSARMCRIVRTLIASGQLSGALLEKATRDAAEDARLFRMGYQTVQAHARLSPVGQAVIDYAAAYMAGVI